MSSNLTDLSWEAFRARVPSRTDLVFVPVGTVEAHGGIPLGTDNMIPAALARDLAPRFEALIAPPVPYGVTDSLLPYPGSTTVSEATFIAYLFEAAAGLVDAGFRRVVLLNGHGGQTDEVKQVVQRLWSDKQAFAVAVEWWGLAEEISREIYPEVVGGHAGVEETAMIQAIAPDLVDEKRHATARRVPRRPGVKARPFPATVILGQEEKSGEGAPVFDRKKAEQFYERVVAEVERVLREVFDGWDELRG